MHFLDAIVLRSVVHLTERRCAWLLVNRHHLTAKKGIDECRLASVEVSSDKDLGGSVLDTNAELINVAHRPSNAFVKQVGDG